MHMDPNARQTLSYLRNLFEERGLHPKNKLGQNFLIDLNLIDLLVRTAELTPDDVVLEVGSGTGSLTVRLLERAGAVVSVEVDPAFAVMTDEAVRDRRDRVALIQGDALKNKNELNPDLFTAVARLKARTGCPYFKVVANLPYSIAVPVISNVLLSELNPERPGGDGAMGDRGAVDGPGGHEALRRPGGADAERGRRDGGAAAAADRVLAAAEGGIGHRAGPAQSRQARPRRRRDAFPPFPARPVRPSAEEPAQGAGQPAERPASARKRWTRSWPSWRSKGRRGRRRWTRSSTCGSVRRSERNGRRISRRK